MEQVIAESEIEESTDLQKHSSKSYALMGIAKGTSVHIFDRQVLNEKNSVSSSPHLVRRLLVVMVLTLVISSALALLSGAPLEEPANPSVTPNPAKAPWYFLGLQELVSYSALVGGVMIPGLTVLGLMLIPIFDGESKNIGKWLTLASDKKWMLMGGGLGAVITCLAIFIGINFPSREMLGHIFTSQIWFDILNPATGLLLAMAVLFFVVKKITGSARTASIALFTCFIVSFIILTVVGTWLRGPNWIFYWPWESWPVTPLKY
jgi:quinol-cytochrome oxidoreductase complex cytochrome b subunit